MALKPPVEVPQGAIRLNTDSQKLEFFAQDQWWEMATDVGADNTGGTRGCTGFKFDDSSNSGVIDYVTIETQGNAIDFGDLTRAFYGGACGSATRGFWFGGTPGADNIEYVEFATAANAVDFGDLTDGIKYSPSGVSDKTRGIRVGGANSPTSAVDIIDYWTMSIKGNAVDFGDMATATRFSNTCNSATRGVTAGGSWANPASENTNRIEYITMQSTGNAADFGDLSQRYIDGANGACGSPTRGIFCHGYTQPGGSYVNTVSYITIASTGNASDFGDTSQTRANSATTSSSIRGINAGGYAPGASPSNYVNTIDYCTIATTGNFTDFGDRTVAGSYCSGTSNGHGGLG